MILLILARRKLDDEVTAKDQAAFVERPGFLPVYSDLSAIEGEWQRSVSSVSESRWWAKLTAWSGSCRMPGGAAAKRTRCGSLASPSQAPQQAGFHEAKSLESKVRHSA